MINHSNGKNRKNINFEGLQELHSGFGYAFACIPFLQAFKKNEKFIIFAFEKTNLYTQKRDTTYCVFAKGSSYAYCDTDAICSAIAECGIVGTSNCKGICVD